MTTKSQLVTKKDLEKDLELLRQDLRAELSQDRRDAFFTFEEKMDVKFSAVFTMLDNALKTSQTWYQEHVVLKSRHDRLENSLLTKGVVKQQDLSA